MLVLLFVFLLNVLWYSVLYKMNGFFISWVIYWTYIAHYIAWVLHCTYNYVSTIWIYVTPFLALTGACFDFMIFKTTFVLFKLFGLLEWLLPNVGGIITELLHCFRPIHWSICNFCRVWLYWYIYLKLNGPTIW